LWPANKIARMWWLCWAKAPCRRQATVPKRKERNSTTKGLNYWLARDDTWSSAGAYLRGHLGTLIAVRQRQQRRRREVDLDLLAWGRRHLPHYFLRAPSQMHEWLGAQLSDLHTRRGTKINVLGPRGGAKSTLGTVCYVLRAALE